MVHLKQRNQSKEKDVVRFSVWVFLKSIKKNVLVRHIFLNRYSLHKGQGKASTEAGRVAVGQRPEFSRWIKLQSSITKGKLLAGMEPLNV